MNRNGKAQIHVGTVDIGDDPLSAVQVLANPPRLVTTPVRPAVYHDASAAERALATTKLYYIHVDAKVAERVHAPAPWVARPVDERGRLPVVAFVHPEREAKVKAYLDREPSRANGAV